MREIIFAIFPFFLIAIGIYIICIMLADFIYHLKYIADMGTKEDRKTIYKRGRFVANKRIQAYEKYGLALYEV